MEPDNKFTPNPNARIERGRKAIASANRLPYKVIGRYFDGGTFGRAFKTERAMLKFAYTRRVVFHDQVCLYKWDGNWWIKYNDTPTEPQLQCDQAV